MTKRPGAGKRLLARIILLAMLFGVVWFVRNRQKQASTPAATEQVSPSENRPATGSQQAAPPYVLEVLRHVRTNGTAPDGYVGGREFQNREKRLPAQSPAGERIRYSEWDVHPKVKGKNRGPERLVTGSDRSAWYTADHYKTFQFIDRR